MKVYQRDGWRCVLCGRLKPLQAHHVVPRSQMGGDVMSNLVSLDSECHAKMDGGQWKTYQAFFHQRIAEAEERGRRAHG
jgi:5-methylcytosine-specific restriction endonuclease McrA